MGSAYHTLGAEVGAEMGCPVGCSVGVAVGVAVGLAVGIEVGAAVGTDVGAYEGCSVTAKGTALTPWGGVGVMVGEAVHLAPEVNVLVARALTQRYLSLKAASEVI